MDPNACLQRLLEAFYDDDLDEALASLEDLQDWLVDGGFLPEVVVTGDNSYEIG